MKQKQSQHVCSPAELSIDFIESIEGERPQMLEYNTEEIEAFIRFITLDSVDESVKNLPGFDRLVFNRMHHALESQLLIHFQHHNSTK